MKVLSQDNVFRSFDGIKVSKCRGIYELHFDDETFISCTKDHKFMLIDGSYIDAEDIRIDSIVKTTIGEKILIYKEYYNDESYVFDFVEIEDTNNYFVNDTLTHQCIFLDEFAFVNDAATFYTSTFPTISSGETTKVIVTSTPNGVGNMFYKLWEGAIQGRSEYKPMKINWWDVPGRDEEWKQKMIANTSELQFSQEYSVEFHGSSDTLISSNVLLSLQGEKPIQERNDIKYYEEPQSDKVYIMTVDVSKGRGQDYSTFTVFDAKSIPFKQVAVYRNNTVSPLFFPEIIVKTAKMYNEALVIIENNDAGHIVCNSVYHEYEYENTFVESAVKALGVGVNMTKRIKKIGCSNLKDLIETRKLSIIDSETIAELCAFEAKNNSYEAAGDEHDDLVMNLVLFSWFVSTDFFKDDFSINLKELLFAERLKASEEDMIPFGFINTPENTPASTEIYEKMRKEQEEWSML